MSIKKYHVNDKGETKPCTAIVACPLGGPHGDFSDPEAARAWGEQVNEVRYGSGLSGMTAAQKAAFDPVSPRFNIPVSHWGREEAMAEALRLAEQDRFVVVVVNQKQYLPDLIEPSMDDFDDEEDYEEELEEFESEIEARGEGDGDGVTAEDITYKTYGFADRAEFLASIDTIETPGGSNTVEEWRVGEWTGGDEFEAYDYDRHNDNFYIGRIQIFHEIPEQP